MMDKKTEQFFSLYHEHTMSDWLFFRSGEGKQWFRELRHLAAEMKEANTIRTIAEIEVSFELREDFREDLENQLAGEYIADDKRYTRELIDDVEKHFPRDWKPETKRELIRYLTCRAELYVEAENNKRRTQCN